jgi:hypothetical protein
MSRSLSPYLTDLAGYSTRQGGGGLTVSPRLGRPTGAQAGGQSIDYYRRRLDYFRTLIDRDRRAG